MKKFAVFVMFFVSMFLFANLTIITEPSAMVYWNGALIDVVPLDGVLELENLDYPGTLKIVKPGYAPYETLVSTDTILKVKLSLPSYIEVTSDPENVDVIVNGNFLGTSPDVFEVSSGELLLTFEKEGYISKKFKITLLPSQIKKFM
ncbi:PEGA domain-containing protein [Thermosipho africanus]|uniref:PEGA domain-containing protein n=1 Tax=Thermosipho africanus TaxID=2421 RepID=UPI0003163DD8|nr:PEGA domain-containing protein [Thermosipho africanus]